MIRFPFYINNLDETAKETFKEFYALPYREVKRNQFEGMWFRTQNEQNKQLSGWKDKNDRRRRILHFYDNYNVVKTSESNTLVMDSSYLYISNTLPEDELSSYLDFIKNELNKENIYLNNGINDFSYKLGDLIINVKKYDRHPKDIEEGRFLPDYYKTLDIIVKSSNFKLTKEIIDKPWKLFKKGIRSPGIKGNPKYTKNIKDIEKYLPAQIELGCGPSIESNVPPLHLLHEVYRVQDKNGTFYIGPLRDNLIINILRDPNNTYREFSEMFKSCVISKPSESHYIIKELFGKGIFVGDVLSNNFDMLCERVGVKEKLLRTYEPDKFFPSIEFHPDAKSLIVIGSHADRKFIQQQARLHGLKIIYIDPEGYMDERVFRPYPIEAPKDEDIILNLTAKEGLNMIRDFVKQKVLL